MRADRILGLDYDTESNVTAQHAIIGFSTSNIG
jgi:hypothetical protein